MEDVLIDQLSMLGNTIYSTSYNEETRVLIVDILSWCPSFMLYVLQNDEYGFQWIYPMASGTNVSFIGMEAVYGDECLSIVYSRCFQLFSVSIQINECNEDTGVSLDNSYLMWVTSLPANDSSDSDISRWKETIGASKNETNETIVLFFDLLHFNYFESCESFSMEFTFDHNITFYEEDDFSRASLITSNNPLFVENSGTDQRLYVAIDVESSAIMELINSIIIDMSILDIWFCVYDTNNSNITGSCFDSGSSSAGGVELWYLYSSTSSATDNGYMTSDDIIIDSSDNLIEQFSFIIPTITNKDADRFGVQIGVELTIEDFANSTIRRRRRRRTRRRELLTDISTYNRIDQTYESGSMTFTDTDNGNGKTGNDPLFGEDAVLYYIIFAVCILLAAAVCVIIYLTCEKKKASIGVKKHVQSIQIGAPKVHKKSGAIEIPPVSPTVKSQPDNGVIVTKQQSIPF